MTDIEVSGGAGGITAHYDDMDAVADVLRSTADRLLDMGIDCQRYLVEVDVAASAILDPVGAGRFQGAMLAALDGPRGLVLAAGAIELDGVRMAAAVVVYRKTDELLADIEGLRRHYQGYVLGVTAPWWVGPAALAGGAWYAGQLLAGDDPAAELQHLITDHPGVVDELVGSMPGFLSGSTALLDAATLGSASRVFHLVTGRSPYPQSVTDGAGLIGSFYPDGDPTVDPLPSDGSEEATRVPGGVDDLFVALDRRNRAGAGQIDVRTITYVDEHGVVRRSHIVDIPGTKTVNAPGFTDSINDMGTNFNAVAGEVTSYERAVAEALEQAGVDPTEPVLVGHSQGGVVAVNAASTLVTTGAYNVTAVVTAGAPTSNRPVPDGVQVLAVENHHDLIPRVGTAEDRDAASWTTVTFDNQTGVIGKNHGISTSYVAAGSAIDDSDDPSIEAWRSDVEGTFFHDPDVVGEEPVEVVTSVYQVTREP